MSTLMTVLACLEAKGYLYCNRSTRDNLYLALVDTEQYKELTGLYHGGAIDNADQAELRSFLDSVNKEEGK